VLAYFVAALSPNMDVANAALPTYVGERRAALPRSLGWGQACDAQACCFGEGPCDAASPHADRQPCPADAVTLLFFAGFLLRFAAIPPWWYWYSVSGRSCLAGGIRGAWAAGLLLLLAGRPRPARDEAACLWGCRAS
jgi:hypothetical protein